MRPLVLLALALKDDFQSIYDTVLSNMSASCDEIASNKSEQNLRFVSDQSVQVSGLFFSTK